LETRLVVPSAIGRHALATVYVEYANTGELAMPAPLLVLHGTDKALMTLDESRVISGIWTSATPQGFSDRVQMLAVGENPGVLQPGESHRLPVYFVGLEQPWDFSDTNVEFTLDVVTPGDETPIEWASWKDYMQPDWVNTEAWEAIWANFLNQVGATWGDYLAMLDDNAAYHARLGASVEDVSLLVGFELCQADGMNPIHYLAQELDASVPTPGLPLFFDRAFAQPINLRYELGPLGRGWTHFWQIVLSQDADGRVTITDRTGTPRIFQPDAREGYFSPVGDYATLTAVGGGAFTLREKDGLLFAFRPDGNLDYVEDTNGNRVTAGYTAGRLTGLTHSSGQSLQISYNAAGRIERVADYFGRETLYTYDPADEHLLSVRSPDGQTTLYAYHSGGGLATKHALTEIQFPDGAHQYFTFYDNGRIKDVFQGDCVTMTPMAEDG